MSDPTPQKALESCRSQIDALDAEIVARLNARACLAREIGRLKSAQGEDIYVPSREAEILRRLAAHNQGPLDAKALQAIYREVISASIALEKRLRIAYLGPEATYTHQAAIRNFGSSVDYVTTGNIPDVFSAVERAEADYGVIPIENSNEGSVFHALDLLAESPLKIIAQVYLPIEHCLLAESPLEAIALVRSKDQALGQCRDWLRRHLPQARLEAVESTSLAAREAKGQTGVAAIASSLAGELYGVPVRATGIQDRAENITRFLVIGKQSSRRSGQDKTSLVLSVNDQPGALLRALEPFSRRNINLTRIESRPTRRKAWDYVFFMDCLGHWEDAPIQEALSELAPVCPFIKWLGSYPNTPRN